MSNHYQADKWITAFLDGAIKGEDFIALKQWLAASPGHADHFMCQVFLLQQLRDRFESQENVNPESLMDLMTLLEDSASEPTIVDITESVRQRELQEQARLQREQQLREEKAGPSARVYVIPKPVIWLGVAAVLGFALWAGLFSGNDRPSQAPPLVVEEPVSPRVHPLPAAHLTAQRDAAWSGDACRPGDALKPGRRLVLTAGYAEITTLRGAIALIEAPCEVELISDNTLRLVHGRMVGIVQTDAAKGFTVRTPHLEVVDLGTRFGIDASRTEATEVHVLEGAVYASSAHASESDTPTELLAGESARALAGQSAIGPVEHDAPRFAALVPKIIPLPGTGHGLAAGDIDPNWQIVAIDGKYLDTPQSLNVNNTSIYVQHYPNDPASSQWFSWMPPMDQQQKKACVYLAQTTLDLPESVQTPGTRLALRYMADNEMRAIHINGHRIELPKVDVFDMFTQFHHVAIAEHLRPGENTVALEVANLRLANSPTGAAAGFRVAWGLEYPALAGPNNP